MIKEGGQISILEVLLEFVCLGYDLFKNKNRIFKKSHCCPVDFYRFLLT